MRLAAAIVLVNLIGCRARDPVPAPPVERWWYCTASNPWPRSAADREAGISTAFGPCYRTRRQCEAISTTPNCIAASSAWCKIEDGHEWCRFDEHGCDGCVRTAP